MKKADRFKWMPEVQEALDTVKQFLMKALILVPPTGGEPLLLYIAATTQVVSAALVVEREEEGHTLKVQRPTYFISEVLSDSKTRYPKSRSSCMPLLSPRESCATTSSHIR